MDSEHKLLSVFIICITIMVVATILSSCQHVHNDADKFLFCMYGCN